MNSSLDAIQESFEDVSLDYTAKPSKFYGMKGHHSLASFPSSTNNIRQNYSTNSLAPHTSKESLLTASQKLRLMKKQRVLQRSEDQLTKNSPENLNAIDFLSDDELPDNLIVFDVPSLHSLHSLSTNKSRARKSPLRRQSSISSNHSNNSANGTNVGSSASSTASPTSISFQPSHISGKDPAITNTHNISQQIDRTTQNPIFVNKLARQQNANQNIINIRENAISSSTASASVHSAPFTIPGSAYPLAQSHLPSRSNTNSTVSSPATRASSIFSKSSDISEFRFSEDDMLSPLSKDVKMLSENKDVRLEETLQRMSMLKHMSTIVAQHDIVLQNTDSSNDMASTSTVNSGSTTSLSTEKVNELTKEKRSYLTATRQSNLPPKSKYETLKHERDLQNILEAEIFSENEKFKQYQLKRSLHSTQNEKDKKSWSKVIKNYDVLIKLPQTRELWWRNVPDSYRSRIWQKQLTSTKRIIFDSAKLEAAISESQDDINEACNFKSIENVQSKKEIELENPHLVAKVQFIEDCSNKLQYAFPEMMVFQFGENFDSVLTILLSFEKLRQKNALLEPICTLKIVNLVCVLYYVFKDCKITLNCLITLVLKKLPHAMLSLTDKQIPWTLTEDLNIESSNEVQSTFVKDIKNQFDKYLLSLAPRVYNHFIQRDVNSLKVIQCLTATVFSDQLDLDLVLRIMDIYLFEGDIMLLRSSLALLKKISYKLFGSKEDIYQVLHATPSRPEVVSDFTKTRTDDIDHDASTITSAGSGPSESLDVGDVDDFITDIREVLKKGKN